MQNIESATKHKDDWKARYKTLYSASGQRKHSEETPRISFMGSDSGSAMFLKLANRDQIDQISHSTDQEQTSLSLQMQERSSSDYGNNSSLNCTCIDDTEFLQMVCAHNRELADEVCPVPELSVGKLVDISTNQDCCSVGASVRSVSRSRVSRMSTRRDMDIPSILAFAATAAGGVAKGHLTHPAFEKIETQQPSTPRWSIRKSVCPVCSQKWRDRSSIFKIKNSGLRKNSSYNLPSVIAPARLRSSITTGYKLPNVPTTIEESSSSLKCGTRGTSASWQLTRARRLRLPKPQMQCISKTSPPSNNAFTELDSRIIRFLKDDF